MMIGVALRRLIGQLSQARARQAADGLTDRELLRRFADGRDEAAFEVLVWRHGTIVLGVCRRLLGPCAEVEDAFQATFLTLVRKAGSIRDGDALAGWLHQVAHRIALQVRAERGKRSAREEALVGEPLAVPCPDVGDREALAVLEEEVARLPAKYRLPVLLCYYQGQPTAEAARQLGCPRGTVLSRLATARQRLRGRLTKRGVTLVAVLGVLRMEQKALATVPAVLVRKALPGAVISAPVAALTEGALRAMLLAKMKVGFAAVLALGLVGAGASGWAYRSLLAAQVPDKSGDKTSAQKPEKEKEEEPNRLKEQLAERARNLLQAREVLDQTERELYKFEQIDSEERTDLRIRLLELEERLRAMRGQHRTQQEVEFADLGVAKNTLENLRQQLKQEVAVAKKPEDVPTVKRLQTQIQEQEDLVHRMQDQFEVKNRQRTEKEIELRRETYLAEEKLERHDRLAAIRRKRITDSMDAASERLRNLQNDDRPADPSGRTLRELIRKVDDLQREVTELRRELRRASSERDK
jgi:RNA polymerase sigma factor (sigma-70 family)